MPRTTTGLFTYSMFDRKKIKNKRDHHRLTLIFLSREILCQCLTKTRRTSNPGTTPPKTKGLLQQQNKTNNNSLIRFTKNITLEETYRRVLK